MNTAYLAQSGNTEPKDTDHLMTAHATQVMEMKEADYRPRIDSNVIGGNFSQ